MLSCVCSCRKQVGVHQFGTFRKDTCAEQQAIATKDRHLEECETIRRSISARLSDEQAARRAEAEDARERLDAAMKELKAIHAQEVQNNLSGANKT